jgi:hypothetical protein
MKYSDYSKVSVLADRPLSQRSGMRLLYQPSFKARLVRWRWPWQNKTAKHLVLLGDSIFDNGAYVGNKPAVGQQVQSLLPVGWRCSVLAEDGAITEDIEYQLQHLPHDSSYLVLNGYERATG